MLRFPSPTLPSTEIRSFSYDFGGQVSVGVTLSLPTATVSVYSGEDATPSDLLSGSASVSGTVVSQLILGSAAVVGVTYRLVLGATTSDGQKLFAETYITVLG